MFAVILNEVYLSMGFCSRMIHLKPHSGEEKESHIAVVVYFTELGKWIFMDPGMGGYLMDEAGNILGIPEIRVRLAENQPLIPNADVGGFLRVLKPGRYRWYLSKNVFKYACPQHSEFDHETNRRGKVSFELLLVGYCEELLNQPGTTHSDETIVYVCDERRFWLAPD